MSIFIEISVIVALAAIISIVMRLLRQPLIIGYIITGLIAGPYVLGLVHSPETIQMFGEIGIAFLLFIVGLNLTPKILKEVGWISLVTGLGQILFTALLGFGLSQWMGFGTMASWYIAIGLTFSSTIIVLKLLSDKGDLDKLYGKISIGFLLFQDIVAMILLIAASSFSSNLSTAAGETALLLVKGVLFTGLFLVISTRVLPRLSGFLARSQELLFMFSIGWGLGIASLFQWVGLSVEVGALIAGVTLAASAYHHEISARMRPLRDFFIVLFFVYLGSQMATGDFSSMIKPALWFSLFVLVGNPIIVMAIMGIEGYRKRTSFLSGLTVAQISEFSLILLAVGVKSGHVSVDTLSLMTLVGMITIGASTYMILYAEGIYKVLAPALGIFERKKLKEKEEPVKKVDAILFGCSRIGHDFLDMFRRNKEKLLVVDYDPEIIERLKKNNIAARYGDMEDPEFLDELNMGKAKLVVSTVPEYEANKLLLRKIKTFAVRPIAVVTAHDVEEAHKLYDEGAAYVIMPHFLGGSYASEMVGTNRFSEENFRYEKAKHLAYLARKKELGHAHPSAERFR